MIRCSSIIFSPNWRSVLPHFYRRLKKTQNHRDRTFTWSLQDQDFYFTLQCLHACNIVVKWYMLLSTLLDEIFLTSLTTFWLRQNVGKKILFDWSFTIISLVFISLHLTFFRMAYIQSTIDWDTFYNMTLKKHRNISLLSFKKLISISSLHALHINYITFRVFKSTYNYIHECLAGLFKAHEIIYHS